MTLALAGKRSEALEAAQVALSIFETKGDKANMKEARELVAFFGRLSR